MLDGKQRKNKEWIIMLRQKLQIRLGRYGTLRFFRKGTFCARHIAKDKMEKSYPCIVCGTD